MDKDYVINKERLTRTELMESLLCYENIICQHVDQGWNPYLLTFIFKDMSNCPELTRIHIMSDEIEEFYRKLLPRIIRKPNLHPCPILIAAPDMPVPKSKKTPLTDPIANEGLHFHAIYLVPPKNRLKISLLDHLQLNRSAYQNADNSIMSIHAEEIQETPWKAVNYVLKSLSRGRFNYDETILILPQTVSELPDQKTPRHSTS